MNGNRNKYNQIRPILLTLLSFAVIVVAGYFSGLFDGADYAISVKESQNRGDVSTPVFSAEGGFYDEAFDLEITVPDGTEVYYTLDGSIPNVRSARYEEPIHVYDRSSEPNVYRSISHVVKDYNEQWVEPETVDKCFVVRAVAADEKGNSSAPVTASYFIGLDKYRDQLVVSLVADPDDLFGENGIYVTGKAYDEWYENGGDDGTVPKTNFEQKGKDWEREANVEILQDTSEALNQQVGLRIQGGSARSVAIKRFSVFSREKYGNAALAFASNAEIQPNWQVAYTRNGLLNYIGQRMGQGRNIVAEENYPVRIFVNGEYWCGSEKFWSLSEKLNEYSVSRRYGVDRSNVEFLRIGYGIEGADRNTQNPYANIHDYIANHDLSVARYYEEYGEIIDIQSYIDMMCIRVYMADCDYCERKNMILWHTKQWEDDKYGDTRWRWGLYDMDLLWSCLAEAFGTLDPWEIDNFTMYGEFVVQTPITQWPIYAALRVNDDFCRQFVLTYMDLINTNFTMNYIEPILENSGGSEAEVAKVRTFFEKRPPYAMKYLAREFDLTGEAQTVTLTTNDAGGGTVTLNTITPEFRDNSWSGLYFTDYPITLTAAAAEGYCFAGWEVNGESLTAETIEVAVQQSGTNIHAIFAPVG